MYRASGSVLAHSLETGAEEVEGARSVPGFTSITTFKGLNSMQFLARAQILRELLAGGVCVMDPNNTYVDPRVRVGAGTMLLPGTILRGGTVIGTDCQIGPNSMLTDCTVGDGVRINASQCEESVVETGCEIGPYALRPHCTVGAQSKIGAFVQLKNCCLGRETKMAHLTYVGDADVGEGCNFGCGTVTCNYDGRETPHHHRKPCLCGLQRNLVAPGVWATARYTAAGSTITRDVPAGDLGVARTRQNNLAGWADKRRKAGRLK